jgi:hypothetical protein
MATIDILNNKQHTLLTELESIKSLLDNNRQVDNIPLLENPVSSQSLPHKHELTKAALTTAVTSDDGGESNNSQNRNGEIDEINSEYKNKSEVETTMLSSFNTAAFSMDDADTQGVLNSKNVLPGQRSLFIDTKTKASTHSVDDAQPVDNSAHKKASSLSENPFLPAHVRQRLKNQSVAYTAAENNIQSVMDSHIDKHADEQELPTKNASYTQQLIDQLVAHHLPKIEAELRQKLIVVVKNYNDQLQK